MTRNPFAPDELDRSDPSLDAVAGRLERYADAKRAAPPDDLALRIRATVDDLPDRRVSFLGSAAAGLRALRAPARGLAIAAVMVAAVVGALALAELTQTVRRDDIGSSPSPPAVVSPTPSPSVSASPTPTPSTTASPTASPTPVPSVALPPSPLPTDSEDDGSDNSGPGGGGSGSGSGSDDG